MRKLVFTLAFCFTFPFSLLAQQDTLLSKLSLADSLLSNDRDSVAFQLLNEIKPQEHSFGKLDSLKYFKLYGDYYLHVNQYKNAVASYQVLWDIQSKSKEEILVKARGLNELGICYMRLSERDSAKKCHHQSVELYKQYDDLQGLAFNYNNLALIYDALGEFDSAVYAQNQSIHYATLIPDSVGIGFGYMGLGIFYHNTNHIVKSLENFLQAQQIFEALDDEQKINYIRLNICSIYESLEDHDAALSVTRKAVQYYEQKNQPYWMGRAYFNLTNSFINLNQLDSALIYIDKAIQNYQKSERPRGLVLSFLAKARIFIKNKEHQHAITSLEESLKLNNKQFLIDYDNAYVIMVNIYLELGEYEKARSIAEQMLKVYDKQIKPDSKVTYYKALYESNKREGNSAKALYYLEQQKNYTDSIANNNQAREMAKVEYNYKLEKEQEVFENEKNALGVELKQQRTLFFISMVAVLAFILVALLILRLYFLKKKAHNQLHQLNEEIEQQSEELKLTNDALVRLGNFKEAMTGMIVHDLKNPLSVILGTESEKPSTKQMARQMLQLVNNMLDVQKFENAEVQLNLKDFSLPTLITETIEQVRPLLSEKNITIIPSVKASIGIKADREMIFRVLVNLLTNAIKFSPNNGTIDIDVTQVKGGINVSIQDHGVGIKQSEIAQIFNVYKQVDARKSGGVASTGIGLAFCKLAIEAHNSVIQVESEEGKGTRFSFYLPKADSDVQHEGVKVLYDDFKIQESEKAMILQKTPQLKALKLYQAFEIEEVLSDLEQNQSSAISIWSKAVLDAAYANNKEYYDELLKKVSQN
ncbi:ATP-binding protein [Limibacter armeniacum]|uniref:tetratricopeptide repeat-containing sensor histidine kinase n=1 Tax=Limibacter armeniacum TaxID=466084 RepID=UPI002FE4FCC8